jgi:hypothetical protein
MDTAIEVWEGEGGTPTFAPEVAQSTRHNRTLWLGLLCAVTGVLVLAVRGKALLRPREEQSKAA